MLYLEIQNGKEATKTGKFQQDIGGNAASTKIIIRIKKGCGKLSSNNTYYDDIWFSGLKTVKGVIY